MKLFITLLLLISLPLAGFTDPAEKANGRAPAAENPASADAGLLTSWMDVQLSAIRQFKIASHHFRQLCYTSIGFYEAVVHGDKQYKSLAGQLNGLDALPLPADENEISWQASGNAAMAAMLRYFYSENPAMVARVDSMELACEAGLRQQGEKKKKIADGSEYGRSIADAVIEWCKSDLSDKENAAYIIPAGDGMWEPTPPKFQNPMRPYGGNNRTIVPGSIENTLPPPPVKFSKERGSEFYDMVNEVYMASQLSGEDKKDIARCWDDSPDGSSLGAGGHWLCILKPAAHATISMAAATVLDKLVGGDFGFTDKAYSYKGYKSRTFKSFKEAGREAGMSRLYGGIHYRPSIEAGYTQGETIAENVLADLEYR